MRPPVYMPNAQPDFFFFKVFDNEDKAIEQARRTAETKKAEEARAEGGDIHEGDVREVAYKA